MSTTDERVQPTARTRGMKPDDLYRIQSVADAQIDPAGRRVAFVVSTLSEEEDEYHASIWLADVDGTSPRPFTRSDGRDGSPRWSPDGKWLAFTAARGGAKAQLYVMPADGGEPRRLTDAKLGVAAPVWAPDSSAICYVGKVSTSAEEDATRDSKKAPRARVIRSLKYKLNGEGFTYDRRKHLFVAGLDGSVRQLTDGDYNDDEPDWSPDGRQIAFVSARHDNRDFDRVTDLFVVDAAGGTARPLTHGRFSVASPSWSPDGRTIAFLAHRDADDYPRHSRLWIVESDGEPRCLTTDVDLGLNTDQQPVWAPDGAAIYVTAFERGTVPVLRVALDGAVTRVVSGDRSVAGVSLDAAGDRLAFVASTCSRPAEAFVAHADGASESRLTGLNDAWLEEVSLAEPEQLSVTGPSGDTIDAWFIRPVGYQPGSAHPLLLNIHGGPFSQYGHTFLDEFQVQAGAGFGVLFSNPRGSTGGSEAFARAIIGEPGVKDTADLMAVVDYTLAHYADIDPARLGVLGGSWGGYLTNWIVGHSDRFAAACTERSISNRFSKAGTDDVYTTFHYIRSQPHVDPELFLRLSPLMYVEAMHTPLLIMHSEEDLRCPIEQAEQLFTALKRLRRDVVFVRFPGENHDLSRAGKPSHRVERFEIQLDFFRARLRLAVAEELRDAVAAD